MKKEIYVHEPNKTTPHLMIRVEQRWRSSSHKNGKMISRSEPYLVVNIFELVDHETMEIETT